MNCYLTQQSAHSLSQPFLFMWNILKKKSPQNLCFKYLLLVIYCFRRSFPSSSQHGSSVPPLSLPLAPQNKPILIKLLVWAGKKTIVSPFSLSRIVIWHGLDFTVVSSVMSLRFIYISEQLARLTHIQLQLHRVGKL